MATGKIVIFVLAVILQTCRCDVQVNGQTEHLRMGSLNRYYLYHSSLAAGRYIDITLDTQTVASLPLVQTEDVAIVIHGREGTAFSEFGQTIRESLMLNNNNMAVILIDWSFSAGLDYNMACNLAPSVADYIATMISTLDDKIDLDKTHIIGFDIGAHIAGMVSRKTRVRKITGLSPAGQNWGEYSLRLNAEDADSVEVIHTDYTGARAFGINDPIGSLNLYANTGTSQPGCSTNQCNHDRAWQLFEASLRMGGHLVGLGCNSMTEMTRNQCTNPPAVILGTDALEKPGTGIYRVNTGRTYPYNV